MKQNPQPQRLTPEEQIAALSALLEGIDAVCRARERAEPAWMLDVRRAQARIAAQRSRRAQPDDQAGGSA